MVPSFPRKAAVDAGYKQSMEEKSIGKYMAVKRRDQGGKERGHRLGDHRNRRKGFGRFSADSMAVL